MMTDTKAQSRCWAAWRDGKIESLGHDKRDILIGYDMMPLRGLAECERRLRSKGFRFGRVRLARDKSSSAWGATSGGRPLADVAVFNGGLCSSKVGAQKTLAHYLSGSSIAPYGSDESRMLCQFAFEGEGRAAAVQFMADHGYRVARMTVAALAK